MQGYHGFAELCQVVPYLRIDHLLALNLLTACVDTARHEVHVEPNQHGAQHVVDAQVVVVAAAGGNQPGHFAHERLDGHMGNRFAVVAVVIGSFSLWQASLQFVFVSLGGLVIGLVIAWPVAWMHRHLDDAPIEITITLLTPYAAYLLANALQMSGVLAVLSAGLYL